MPKSPSPSGCSKRQKVPDSLFQERGQNCSWSSPGQPLGLGLLLLPSLGQERMEFNHHLPSSLSSPWAGTSQGKQNALCSPRPAGRCSPEPYDPVHIGAGINPCGKAVAMMQGEPGERRRTVVKRQGTVSPALIAV